MSRKIKPAESPEGRERQLTNLAINLAEKQLLDGTASPSVITHFLKMASSREAIERDILEKQARLVSAKADSIESSTEAKEMYANALDAMKNYGPSNE